MNWFPIHIVIKDLSFLIFYLTIMKYNLTLETFLPETVASFPKATSINLLEMIQVSLFYNVIPIVVSLGLYYPIVQLGKVLMKHNNKLRLIATGFVLTLITPIAYFVMTGYDMDSPKKAELLAWFLTFVVSMSTYYVLNRKRSDV
ncbi:hypothetical protein SAMN05660841_00009 [Sphingobacterium nematocida]|uniref:Uncharacterized protein n=1 Tax=Sphingobacterium nematocida TaxID=1513896 RepID=A0A1T5AMM3_9SPHI|nr:hypothetical protein [Sphingobacterium nematocida]SKB36079.1 hypothetical protein SAMN05660841_00009 [Sphingobacterium nematocida]